MSSRARAIFEKDGSNGLRVYFDTSYDFVCVERAEQKMWVLSEVALESACAIVLKFGGVDELPKAQAEVLRLTKELRKVKSERDKYAAVVKRVEGAVKEGRLV